MSDLLHESFIKRKNQRPNHAMERTADPRHASCIRTCRATGRGPLIAVVPPQDPRGSGHP